MNRQRIWFMVASAIGLISIFMPWLKSDITEESVRGIDTSIGWTALIAFIAVIVISLLIEREYPVSGKYKKTILVLGGLSIINVIYNFATMRGRARDAFGDGDFGQILGAVYAESLKWQFGIFLTLIASVGVVVLAFFSAHFGDDSY